MKRLLRGALGRVAPSPRVGRSASHAAVAAAIPAPGVPTNVTVVAGGQPDHHLVERADLGPAPTKYQVSGTNAGTTCAAVLTTTCVLTLPPTKPTSTAGLTVSYKVRAFNGTKAGAVLGPGLDALRQADHSDGRHASLRETRAAGLVDRPRPGATGR